MRDAILFQCLCCLKWTITLLAERLDAPTDIFSIAMKDGAITRLRGDARAGVEDLPSQKTTIETLRSFDGLSISANVYRPAADGETKRRPTKRGEATRSRTSRPSTHRHERSPSATRTASSLSGGSYGGYMTLLATARQPNLLRRLSSSTRG